MGKSHACEGVLTTLLGITRHGEALLWLTPFQQGQGESIPKRVFAVKWAVVHCNKKPDREFLTDLTHSQGAIVSVPDDVRLSLGGRRRRPGLLFRDQYHSLGKQPAGKAQKWKWT